MFTISLLTRNDRVHFVGTYRPGGLCLIQHLVQIPITARR